MHTYIHTHTHTVNTQGVCYSVDSPIQNFMEILEGKSVKIEEITDQASLLKAEDGEKKNGTSDVESR